MKYHLIYSFFLLPFFSVGQVNLSNGLMAYYPFSGNANDVSGNNNNPVFNNATLTPDRFGVANNAYRFNGVNNYMRIPNHPTLNFSGPMSIFCWVRPQGFYQGTCHGNSVIMKGDNDYLPGNYLIRYDDNLFSNGQNCSIPLVDSLHQNFYGNGPSMPGGYTPYVQKGLWHAVAYIYDGATVKLYVDCQLKGSSNMNLNFTNAYDLMFGKLNNPSFPYWLNADLDEVRLYNRALTIDEVKVLSDCSTSSCNNWLYNTSQPSYVSVGDLDIPGNKITVEAIYNRTQPYTDYASAGDIVSKHFDQFTSNYLLRPNTAEISTSTGYYRTPNICNAELNKTYHVAFTYDGSILKFYRNGFLMSQIPATGDLIQNNYQTRIGLYEVGTLGVQFKGYINEVRIWNIVRSQSQIQANMNTSLPSPTTQSGLMAYYTFDNLLNKQGNSTFNGVLGGAATINATNPQCTISTDSCNFSCSSLSISTSEDTSFCTNAVVSHQIWASSTTSGTTYSWTPTAGLSNPSIPNPIVTLNNTTTYYVTATNGNCSTKDSVKITITPAPIVKTIADTNICANKTALLNTTGAQSYQWSPSTNLSGSNIANPIFSAAPGLYTYYVTGSNANGCTSKDTVNIKVNALPIIQTINDTIICSNNSLVISTIGADLYEWTPITNLNNPSIANPTFSGTSGFYTLYVTGTSVEGCQSKDSVTIEVQPFSFNTPTDTSVCKGKSVVLNGANGNKAIYEWQPNIHLSDNTIVNPVANPSVTTIYNVTVTLPACKVSRTFPVEVVVHPTPNLQVVKSGDIICGFGNVQLMVNGAEKYTWWPLSTLSSGTGSIVTASPLDTTTYTVTATSKFGCVGKDSIVVNVDKSKGGYYIPNAFTPNHDGLNDCFGIKLWGIVKNLRFMIYNRWGEMVFYTTNPAKCWDGIYKGEPALAGSYVYYIEGDAPCGHTIQKGNVLLIR